MIDSHCHLDHEPLLDNIDEIIRKISFMLYPIIPDTINKALKIFNLNSNDIIFESIGIHDYLKAGDNINMIGILFKKIEKND